MILNDTEYNFSHFSPILTSAMSLRFLDRQAFNFLVACLTVTTPTPILIYWLLLTVNSLISWIYLLFNSIHCVSLPFRHKLCSTLCMSNWSEAFQDESNRFKLGRGQLQLFLKKLYFWKINLCVFLLCLSQFILIFMGEWFGTEVHF